MFTFFSCGSKILFGDNLDQRIQDINAQSKIKSSLASNGQGKISYRSRRWGKFPSLEREHYTKIFNSFPSHQKAPAWVKQPHKRRRVSLKRKSPYYRSVLPMVNLIFLCTYSDKNLISMWVVTCLISLNSGL